MRNLPGFLTRDGLIAGAVALMLVAAIGLIGRGQMFSPGPLSARAPLGQELGGISSHAELSTRCDACHAPPWTSQDMSSRCLECHAEIREELADPLTLHGLLQATNCRDCHVEHRGAQASATDMTNLVVDHEQFGFSLAAHQMRSDNQPFLCADCHTRSLGQFEPATCETCHRTDDPDFTAFHVRDFGDDCLACHDGTDRFSQDNFDHNTLAFPLLGRHAQVVCVDCHPRVADFEAFKNAPTLCVECHLEANPHPPNFGERCADCHNTEGWQTDIFDHDLTTFKLTGKHINVNCEQCHVNRVFQGTPRECVDCHVQDDVHNLMLGADCADCHVTEDWKLTNFNHETTGYPLTGKHREVACADCHVNNIFAGTPQTCVSCHAEDDVHRGQFGQDCALCHTTDTWQRGPFEHTFPLDHGGRGIIACTTCHTVPGNYKAYTCYNCHAPADMQRVHFFASMMGTDITDCVRCHPTGQRTMQMH